MCQATDLGLQLAQRTPLALTNCCRVTVPGRVQAHFHTSERTELGGRAPRWGKLCDRREHLVSARHVLKSICSGTQLARRGSEAAQMEGSSSQTGSSIFSGGSPAGLRFVS
jgi:hypothetical protein